LEFWAVVTVAPVASTVTEEKAGLLAASAALVVEANALALAGLSLAAAKSLHIQVPLV